MIPKLKAWHKTEKRMLPVLCIDFTGTEIQKGTPCIVAYENDGCYPLKDVELLLYSGNVDINKKEICEGDIVYRHETGNNYVVSFEHGNFLAKLLIHEFVTYLSGIYPFRYVGNIYENPELLEDK